MSSLLGHCHGENWKSPTRSFGRSGKAKRTFEERKKNVFVKPNEQCRACSDIVMARIGNRQHGALGEVERQNALLRNEKRILFCLHTMHLWLSKSISVCLCLVRSSTRLIFVHIVVNGIRCKDRKDVHVGIFDG